MNKRWISKRGILKYGVPMIFGGLGLAWVTGIVLYPAENPPQRYEGVILSSQSDPVLRRACFDCHSNETKYPWYFHLPVIRLAMGHNIQEGREELNFSRWAQMPANKKFKMIKESLEETREGEMPPLDYKLIHRDSVVTQAELDTIGHDLATLGALQGATGGDLDHRKKGGDHDDDDDDDDHDDDDDGKRHTT